MNISYFDSFIYMQLHNKVQNSFLKTNIQFEKFYVPLRRTSIGFSMNYSKFFTCQSKMNTAIKISVLKIDVENGLMSVLDISVPCKNFSK